MIITRATSADTLNRVLASPQVQQQLNPNGEEPITDLSPLLTTGQDILLECEHGGFWLHDLGDCLFEVHTLFEPGTPSEYIRKAVYDGFWYMFTETSALAIHTRVPRHNVPARRLTAGSGFKYMFTMDDTDFFRRTIDDWVINNFELEKTGEWFHDKLEDHKSHEDDSVHDAYVGLAVELIRQNQPNKAEYVYNQWASYTGYAPMSIVGDAVFAGDMQILIKDDGYDFEVIQ